jgi:hypothetical protein
LFLLETVLLFARDTVLLSHVSLHKDGPRQIVHERWAAWDPLKRMQRARAV